MDVEDPADTKFCVLSHPKCNSAIRQTRYFHLLFSPFFIFLIYETVSV